VTQAGAVLDDTGFAISSAAGDQFNPAVAFDGTRYVVAWDDKRSGSKPDIYAARVSTSGAVLDKAGIAVCAAADGQFIPAVAGGSKGFLVAWTDQRASIKGDIYAARVSGAGSVLDPGGVAVAADARAEEGAAVAWDGANFLVVWQHDHYPNVWDVRGARFSPAGKLIDTSSVGVCTDPLNQHSPALAFDGARYQVVWSGWYANKAYDIAGARISVGGQVEPQSQTVIASTPENQLVPAVAAGGGKLLVVWQDKRSGAIKNDIYAARLGQ